MITCNHRNQFRVTGTTFDAMLCQRCVDRIARGSSIHARVAAVRARQGIPAPRHPFAVRLYPSLGFFVGAATLADHWATWLFMLPGFALLRSAVNLAGPVCPSCNPDMEDMHGLEATEIPLEDRLRCARCHRIDY